MSQTKYAIIFIFAQVNKLQKKLDNVLGLTQTIMEMIFFIFIMLLAGNHVVKHVKIIRNVTTGLTLVSTITDPNQNLAVG